MNSWLFRSCSELKMILVLGFKNCPKKDLHFCKCLKVFFNCIYALLLFNECTFMPRIIFQQKMVWGVWKNTRIYNKQKRYFKIKAKLLWNLHLRFAQNPPLPFFGCLFINLDQVRLGYIRYWVAAEGQGTIGIGPGGLWPIIGG